MGHVQGKGRMKQGERDGYVVTGYDPRARNMSSTVHAHDLAASTILFTNAKWLPTHVSQVNNASSAHFQHTIGMK